MKSGLFITLLLASAISMFAVPKDNCVFSGDDEGPFFNTTATFNYASQRKDVTEISPNNN